MRGTVIEVEGVTKRYGAKLAVSDISFNVNEKEVVGFLGPNGAGKSTTMNIITGYISSGTGSVRIAGTDILSDPIEAKRKMGYLPEHPPLYPEMTVNEQLDFVYAIRRLRGEKKRVLDDACELVKISDVRERVIKNPSKGYKQRVGLAQALLGSPDILIMDEPAEGLDPKQIVDIRNVIRELGKSYTIVLSSHNLSEVSAICERVIIINKGRIVADGDISSISGSLSGEQKLFVRVAGPKDEVMRKIAGIRGVSGCEYEGSKEKGAVDCVVRAEPGMDVRRSLALELARLQYPIIQMNPVNLSLESIYLRLTADDGTDSEPAARARGEGGL